MVKLTSCGTPKAKRDGSVLSTIRGLAKITRRASKRKIPAKLNPLIIQLSVNGSWNDAPRPSALHASNRESMIRVGLIGSAARRLHGVED
jgi:hypothetical protein